MKLQQAVDTYMRFVQQNPPCVAPNYPPEWLVKRALSGVRNFQDPHSLAHSAAVQRANQQRGLGFGGGAFGELGSLGGLPADFDEANGTSALSGVTSWWDIAAQGLKAWYASSRLSLVNTEL